MGGLFPLGVVEFGMWSCMAYLSWDCKQDPAKCIDRGISLRNRNPCSQRISCDCFKYGMSRSLVSCRTKMFILFHCSIQTFRFLESIMIIQQEDPTRGLSTFLNEREEDLLIQTTYCRVDYSDLSLHRCHRCRFRSYEWDNSRNSQRKIGVS